MEQVKEFKVLKLYPLLWGLDIIAEILQVKEEMLSFALDTIRNEIRRLLHQY